MGSVYDYAKICWQVQKQREVDSMSRKRAGQVDW